MQTYKHFYFRKTNSLMVYVQYSGLKWQERTHSHKLSSDHTAQAKQKLKTKQPKISHLQQWNAKTSSIKLFLPKRLSLRDSFLRFQLMSTEIRNSKEKQFIIFYIFTSFTILSILKKYDIVLLCPTSVWLISPLSREPTRYVLLPACHLDTLYVRRSMLLWVFNTTITLY